MKKGFGLITVILLLTGCTQNPSPERVMTANIVSASNSEQLKQADQSFNPANLLTLSDAEQILGEKCRLTDSSTMVAGKNMNFTSSFTAISQDKKSGKTGALYFLFEAYDQISAAQKKYSYIKTANEDHPGVMEIKGLGDEAYFHTDSVNFYFVMVRKSNKVFNMKVNKITSNTSLTKFQLITNKIANKL